MYVDTDALEASLTDIAQRFDYDRQRKRARTEYDLAQLLPATYRVGCIVGASGSGKSTLLQQLKRERTEYQDLRTFTAKQCTLPVLTLFDNHESGVERLCMAGVSTVPSWFVPIHELSAGEQTRCQLARYLDSFVLVDEFTTNLDRWTARSVAHGLHKYVHKHELEHVLVAGAHRDILPWLQPDFVIDLDTVPVQCIPQQLSPTSTWNARIIEPLCLETDVCLLDQRRLTITSASQERWSVYAPYHYLSDELNTAARCWEAWLRVDNDIRPVAFLALLGMPHATIHHGWREHRLVVLPQVQGMGIGMLLSETVAHFYVYQLGRRYFSRTSHPGLGMSRNKRNHLWRATSTNEVDVSANVQPLWDIASRVSYSHEFIARPKRMSVVERKVAPVCDTGGEWRPLTLVGQFYRTTNSLWLRMHKQKYRFSFRDYNDDEAEALRAAEQKQLQLWQATPSDQRKTNLFRKDPLRPGVVEIQFSCDESEGMASSADRIHVLENDLSAMRNHLWTPVYLNGQTHAHAKIEGKYRCVEEHLLQIKWRQCVFRDENPLNCVRDNLSVSDTAV